MPAKDKSKKLSKAEKQALHAALNSKFGIALAKARQLIDENGNNVTLETIEQALTNYLRTATKG